MSKIQKHKDFKEHLFQELQDSNLELAYLNEAIADEDSFIIFKFL